MPLKDELKRIRKLSDQAQKLNALKKKLAEEFDKGTLNHDRLGMYMKERDKILKDIEYDIEV
jgi:hypothetical protein